MQTEVLAYEVAGCKVCVNIVCAGNHVDQFGVAVNNELQCVEAIYWG